MQGNKAGLLYVLNRDTGKPIFPVEERAVPQSDVPGELTSPTQSFPVTPPPLVPQPFPSMTSGGRHRKIAMLAARSSSNCVTRAFLLPPAFRER
jgi:glucose dehydrogenase